MQVASDWQRRGLGRMLLNKLMAYLRARGTAAIRGECLQENKGMIALARELGFSTKTAPEDIVELALPLRSP